MRVDPRRLAVPAHWWHRDRRRFFRGRSRCFSACGDGDEKTEISSARSSLRSTLRQAGLGAAVVITLPDDSQPAVAETSDSEVSASTAAECVDSEDDEEAENAVMQRAHEVHDEFRESWNQVIGLRMG